MAADGSWLWRRLKQLFGAGVAIAVLLALIRHLQSAHRPPLLLKPPEATGPRTTPRRRRATRNFESSPIALAVAEPRRVREERSLRREAETAGYGMDVEQQARVFDRVHEQRAMEAGRVHRLVSFAGDVPCCFYCVLTALGRKHDGS